MEHAVVDGDYITFKHVKTRKVVVLEIEVPEEQFQHVINTLGMPVGGESKHVAVCLLDKTALSSNGRTPDFESGNCGSSPREATKTEGEKLRTRAVLLCKEREFQIFCEALDKSVIVFNEDAARDFICQYCEIKSRSEIATNMFALVKFRKLLEKFNSWQFEQQYADNLNR